MKVVEPRVFHDIYQGVIEGKDVERYEKKFSEVMNLYENTETIDPNTIVYTVYSYGEGDTNKVGNLLWGLTILEPVYINGECYMTRGHFHQDTNCAEMYFGIDGEGLLVLMDENDNIWSEKVYKGSLHHIDGRWAHRLVNTGDKQMKVGACWPTTAGHDYKRIEDHEFSYRIFKDKDDVVFKKR